MTMKRSSRLQASGFADTANGNPFAVFEIIADARWIRECVSLQSIPESAQLLDRARRIELHADGMIKTILGTADLSTAEIPASVIEQIVDMLRTHRV